MGFLRVGYRYCPVLRAVDEQRGDGDFVQSACHVAAQAMPGHIVFLGRGEGHTPLRRVRLAVDLVYEFPGKMLRIMYGTTCEQAPAQHAPAAAEELVREFLEVGYVYEEVGRAVPGHFVLDAVGIDEHQPVHPGGVVQGEAEGDAAAQ